MRNGYRMAFAFVAGLLMAADGAAAQALTGRVFDGTSGEAVAGAEVAVLGDDVAPIGLAVSDSAGAFHIPLGDAGSYRLVATAVGYDSLSVDSIAVGDAEAVWVELRLGPRPFDVEGLTVVARRPTGPLSLREFYRRLDRYEQYGGSGVVLSREALDRHIAQTGASVLARESIHVREVTGLGGGIIVKRRTARFGQSQWCTPAFFLDGNRVDGQTIRSIPASDLLGIELYRGVGDIPAEFMTAPGATSCGVVLAWSRRDAYPDSGGPTRPLTYGVYADGAKDKGLELGMEVDRGIARLLVGWIELGLRLGATPVLCDGDAASACSEASRDWSAVVGASLFLLGSDGPVAPYAGGGIGLGGWHDGIEPVSLWRVGVELVAGPVRLRAEVREAGGRRLGIGLLF
ncbi:MAG: carboxypeptidase-like regulatory domain-containing protein [Longimicrobiales bacterium]